MEEEERKRAREAVEALLKRIDDCMMLETTAPLIKLTRFDLCFIKHCIIEHVKAYDPMMFERE